MYRRRPKSKSRSNGRSEINSEQSGQSNSAKKTLKTAPEQDDFLNICEVFECFLNKVENDILVKEVHDILLRLYDTIGKKLKLFDEAKNGSAVSDGNLTPFRSLASSTLSLSSATPEMTLDLESDLIFKQFLVEVICPFCSQLQPDKKNLTNHLKSCKAFTTEIFSTSNSTPYSTFQILPNNAFKCNACPNSVLSNVKSYILHGRSSHHVTNFEKLSKNKQFSEYLFCSCCKVLVANTFTQLDIHMHCEVHTLRSEKAISKNSFIKKGVHCLYVIAGKFKCLVCPSWPTFSTAAEIFQHLSKKEHLNVLLRKRLSIGKMYCEFCSEEVQVLQLEAHLTSQIHLLNKNKEKNKGEPFELCLYCGFVCNNLKELAVHLKTNCNESEELWNQNLIQKKCDTKLKSSDNKIKKNTKKQNFIIVEGNVELQLLFGYFKKFGEVTAVEVLNDNRVMIEFKDKSSLNKVLPLQDVIRINNVKVKIIDNSELKSEEEEEKQEETECPELVDMKNEKINNCDMLVNNSGNRELEDDEFQQLFDRVSGHLIRATEKFNSDTHKSILSDCSEDLKVSKCTFIGFMGAGLSYSVESISIYFQEDEFNKNLAYAADMLDLQKWKDVTYVDESLPYIKATHRATDVTCKIKNSLTAKFLTNLLRYHQEEKDFVKPFCSMVRFWLSVHDLSIRKFEYFIIFLLIRFLHGGNIKPPLDLDVLMSEDEFEVAINDLRKSDRNLRNTSNIKKLFMEFMSFLIEFDFDEDAKLPVVNKCTQFEGPKFILDPLHTVNLAEGISEDDENELLDSAENMLNK